jgi:dihydroneopterin aldolase
VTPDEVTPGEVTPGPMTARSAAAVLEVRGVRFRACLGWSAGERARPQEVEVGVRLEFAALPRACKTDELSDTVCYAQLLECAERVCTGREFRLVEHLAHVLADELRKEIPAGAALELTVTKLHAPLPYLHGGVHFTLRR